MAKVMGCHSQDFLTSCKTLSYQARVKETLLLALKDKYLCSEISTESTVWQGTAGGH